MTNTQKAQIVLEMFREDKSVAQIASENNIHPNQLHRWKKQAQENFPSGEENQGKEVAVPKTRREEQELACSKLPPKGSDGLKGCQQEKKRERTN
ncbi:MAG: transposase [Anaerolineales bacterium]|nr:transposase [Anaerolineales bacterium]